MFDRGVRRWNTKKVVNRRSKIIDSLLNYQESARNEKVSKSKKHMPFGSRKNLKYKDSFVNNFQE